MTDKITVSKSETKDWYDLHNENKLIGFMFFNKNGTLNIYLFKDSFDSITVL